MRTDSSSNKQVARPTGCCESDGGCRVGWRTSRTMPSSVVCNRPYQQAPESPRSRSACAKENTTKAGRVGVAAGQEQCSEWRRGTQARPVAPAPSQRANNARRNPRTVFNTRTEGIQVARCGGWDVSWGGSLKRGVPTGSARSRPEGMGTVGAGETTGAGTVTTAGGDCGRGAGWRGVSTPCR